MSAADLRPLECNGPDVDNGGLAFGYDAAGFFYELAYPASVLPSQDTVLTLRRIAPDGSEETLAYLLKVRCTPYPCSGASISFRYWNPNVARFDATNGSLLLAVESQRNLSTGSDEPNIGIIEISGFPKLFDTLLTFVPGGQSLTALTPAHPDGFRSAASLQVWTGNVRTLPDWSQAQPLTCNAASSPAPGQVVTVPDTLPDPARGEGRYYVVASRAADVRRLGRQYAGGQYSARNPTGLPVCP